jgi:VIT1/CCC1 family predicted Fe2+/Mn2+ transporter
MAVEGLTRTVLRFGEEPTLESLEGLVRILQRVPGVLVVVADRLAGSVAIDHDDAVELDSLRAGVRRAGFVPVVAGVSRRVADSDLAGRRRLLGNQRFLLCGAALFGAAFLLAVYAPTVAARQWLLVALAVVFWTVFFLNRSLQRREK